MINLKSSPTLKNGRSWPIRVEVTPGKELRRMSDASCSPSSYIVWRVIDEKPGHRNQVVGLTEALERVLTLKCHDISVPTHREALSFLLPSAIRTVAELPSPSLLIGAGHSTHLPLLLLRRTFGGRAIVMMKPTLPMSAFDLNIISSVHRLRRVPKNVLLTTGPVNRVRRSSSLSDREGLILIGGLSDQFYWSDEAILRQVTRVLQAGDGVRWTITTSRRTPPSFSEAWRSAGLPGELVPFELTAPDWILQKMQRAGRIWVTCDSMSMVYEALTSGAGVGLIELPERRRSHAYKSAQQLIQDDLVTSWAAWIGGQPLRPPPTPLCEADRCATEVIARFLTVAAKNLNAA